RPDHAVPSGRELGAAVLIDRRDRVSSGQGAGPRPHAADRMVFAGHQELRGTAMDRSRRRFLGLAAAGMALPAMSRLARAQAYPPRRVGLVVGSAAGGTRDIGARLIGQGLQERLGQPFVIENRAGAATNIATESVVRAPADGYTLLMVGPSSTINATLYDNL